MKISLSNCEAEIHIRFGDKFLLLSMRSDLLDRMIHNPRRETTVYGTLTRKETATTPQTILQFNVTARCSTKDQFCKAQGRKEAARKLCEVLKATMGVERSAAIYVTDADRQRLRGAICPDSEEFKNKKVGIAHDLVDDDRR